MPAYAPTPLVQQHALDALGGWVTRATGLVAYHGDQDATKLAAPYVSIEWVEEPSPDSARRVVEATGLPSSATITLSAAEGAWSAASVNLAHPGLRRGAGETLTVFADRWAAALVPFLAGRVAVTRNGTANVVLTPVVAGDLWRAVEIENAAVVLGAGASARVASRVYSGLARVWVIGAARTSGKSGEAGGGTGIMELLALLTEALSEDWCHELFDQYGVRCATPEPEVARNASRRSNAKRETRAFIDIQIGVSARFGLPPEPVQAVGFGGTIEPQDPEIEGVTVEVLLET